MMLRGIRTWRSEVVETTPCVDCRAEPRQKCRKIQPRGMIGFEIDYVHDSRAYQHHTEMLFIQNGIENPYC